MADRHTSMVQERQSAAKLIHVKVRPTVAQLWWSDGYGMQAHSADVIPAQLETDG